MNDKKHIDRLFQEGFKDFEATPSNAVWKRIEAELNQKKKKRRMIPIWWRYAGVAALLLLLLTLGFNYFNDLDAMGPTNQVVETDGTSAENKNFDNKDTLEDLKDINAPETYVLDHNDPKEDVENANEKSNFNSTQNKPTPSNNTSIAKSSISKNNNSSKTNTLPNPAIANTSKETTLNKTHQNKPETNITMASSNAVDSKNETSLINKEKAKELINNTNNNVANTKDDKTETLPINNKETKTLTIEEALNNNKDIIEDEKEKQNRWSIAPNAAPVYFNTLGEGSSIDPQFNKNSKSGDLNMSFGLSASYAINNKITVRSGINKVNLGYNTNDVIVFQSAGLSSSNSALQNVNSGGGLSRDNAISVISAENLNSNEVPINFSSSNTSLNQALGYIEIPLEIQYKLSDKKFGVNVIGGFSSFFLNNNEIFSESENGNRTFLGEANNINKISYSANFGLGFNYHVSKKIDLNLEPMFKYQINTFKNTSGNFTPFFIGVYTGFGIKF